MDRRNLWESLGIPLNDSTWSLERFEILCNSTAFASETTIKIEVFF